PGQKIEPQNKNRFVQHIDILPTLAALLDFPQPKRLKFGQNIFSPGEGLVFNGDERSHWLLKPDHYVEYTRADGQFLGATFDAKRWQTGELHPLNSGNAPHNGAPQIQTMEELKAILDYHNQGVLQNKLYH